MFFIRKSYYSLIGSMSGSAINTECDWFAGLYDKDFIDILRKLTIHIHMRGFNM